MEADEGAAVFRGCNVGKWRGVAWSVVCRWAQGLRTAALIDAIIRVFRFECRESCVLDASVGGVEKRQSTAALPDTYRAVIPFNQAS